MHLYLRMPLLATFFLLAAGCSSGETGPEEEQVAPAQMAAMGDAQTIVRRPDGLFDVTCVDGRQEVRTEQELLANQVCLPPPGSDDPLNPASCVGDPITADVLSVLRPELNGQLGRYEIVGKYRDCAGTTCGLWREGNGTIASDAELRGILRLKVESGSFGLQFKSDFTCQSGPHAFADLGMSISTPPDEQTLRIGNYTVPRPDFIGCVGQVVAWRPPSGPERGILTDHCMRVEGEGSRPLVSSGSVRREYRVAALVRY